MLNAYVHLLTREGQGSEMLLLLMKISRVNLTTGPWELCNMQLKAPGLP